MAEDHVEVLRRGYAEFNRSGAPPREDLAPDAEFDPSRVLPDVEVVRGRDALLELIRQYSGSFENFSIEPQEFIEAGDQVVVVVRDGGRLKGSGAEIWNTFLHVWSFRDGKVVRWASFLDRQEALEAVGLRE